MKIESLATSRLELRMATPEVYDFVFDDLTDERALDFFGFEDQDKLIIEKERHAKGLKTFNKSFLYFFLIDSESNKNIGWCGYHTWYLDHHRAELGYGFTDMSYEGKGLMTEAIERVLSYGFEEMNLHRIEAFVSPENTPSLKIMEKNNFRKEGHLKEHYFKNGIAEDSLVFALLKSEQEAIDNPSK
ncbi:MAG: GNAT family protein [Crocinitomicaceae bacterium]|nr:GNAT family protein [Crocinitomicaceae bacterium]